MKQIGLALGVVLTLLVGSVSACMCSHHEVKKELPKISCHGPAHETTANSETPTTGDAVDVDCVCFVNQSVPYVVTKSENRKAKPAKDKGVSSSVAVVAVAFSADAERSLLPIFDDDLSHSSTLRFLLPSRAPPRL